MSPGSSPLAWPILLATDGPPLAVPPSRRCFNCGGQAHADSHPIRGVGDLLHNDQPLRQVIRQQCNAQREKWECPRLRVLRLPRLPLGHPVADARLTNLRAVSSKVGCFRRSQMRTRSDSSVPVNLALRENPLSACNQIRYRELQFPPRYETRQFRSSRFNSTELELFVSS